MDVLKRSYVEHADTGVDPIDGRWTRSPFQLWARWNDDLGQRYTLGVEEELMLLHPDQWSLAQCSDDVLARLSILNHTRVESGLEDTMAPRSALAEPQPAWVAQRDRCRDFAEQVLRPR